LAGASSTDGVVLSSGITAEKLMYDRALEMSRSAAINEIANEDLEGCQISYMTAIRMLEAVLENDDEMLPRRRRSTTVKEEKDNSQEGDGTVNGINLGDRESVLKGNYSYLFIILSYLCSTTSFLPFYESLFTII
jgi:serine/threonine-protein kinase ULK/ATG1